MPLPTVHPHPGAGATLLVAALWLASAGAQEAAPAAAAGPNLADQKAALEGVVELRVEANEEAAALQEQISEIADQTDAVAAQHRTALKQIEALRRFNDQMRNLIGSQRAELDSVADQLDRVEEVGRNVTPLMLRMIDALEAFVDLDLPFLLGDRRERIANLRSVMDRADISSATKFRQIMEAYQIENEYGRTIEAYRGEVQLGGESTVVDLLRFGRISLVYQSLDGTQSGVWNQAKREWELLDPEQNAAIRSGLRVARQLEPPDLIQVPLPPPDGAPAGVAELAEARP